MRYINPRYLLTYLRLTYNTLTVSSSGVGVRVPTDGCTILYFMASTVVHRMHDGTQLELNPPTHTGSQWSCNIN